MITRWNPFNELTRLQREMNDLFDTRMSRSEDPKVEQGWRPAVDIFEDSELFVLTAELPGLTSQDVEVKMEDQQLSIRGERKLEHEDKRDGYHRIERTYGRFMRTFSLPNTVESEKIEASYKNGLLQILIPKRTEVLPKQITVKVTG